MYNLYKQEVLLIVAIVEFGDLELLNDAEVFELWSFLAFCEVDDKFLNKLKDEERKSISNCVIILDKELNKRGHQQINFLRMMKENPEKVTKILKKLRLGELMNLKAFFQRFKKNDLTKQFLLKIENQMMTIIPLA